MAQFVSPRIHKAVLGCIFVISLLAGCSKSDEPLPAATPVEAVISESTASPTIEATATDEPQPTPQPTATAEPLNMSVPFEEVVRNTVPQSVFDTAEDLWNAERPPHNRLQLTEALRDQTAISVTPVGDPPDLEVGDRIEFFLNKDLDGRYRPELARLRYVSDHANWWATIAADVSDQQIKQAAAFFESDIVPINRLVFGIEPYPGIDNDPRFHILLVEEPDWGGVYGYFSNLNQYPTEVFQFSNEKEMFVVNIAGVRVGSVEFAGELGHEYQHLIHWNLDPNEEIWMQELMSELAIFFSGAQKQLASERSDTNFEIFSQMPGIQLTSRPERRFGANDKRIFAHYAAERQFGIYLLEQFGPEFIKAVISNPAPGIKGIQEELDKLPEPMVFADVFANWLIANLTDQPQLAEGQYGYEEIDILVPEREIITRVNSDPIADKLLPFGARYFEIRADDDVDVHFTGSTMARLTPADPASGQYAWYSGRGDESEFNLTRAFDLSGLDSATLNYKVWYELEEFYDYGYLQISTDDGKTWQLVETGHGTDSDPKKTAYGWGYTGTTLDWLDESIDLTPYVGQEILLRFSVVNDFSTHRDGMQIDDITIPELGYFDGAEDNAGGWEATGFVRSTNLVPADWIVWLVELTNPTTLTRIALSPEQTAEFTISGFGDDFPFAAVVVAPTAPVTTMSLPYELVFEVR